MKYELVNYCEFDKYASKAYSLIHNESEDKNLGDITLVDEKEIADFNMMIGGSPCQDFSVAGKQDGAKWTCKDCGYEYNPLEAHYTTRDKCPKCNSINIEKTRSSLLVEWLRILREKKPNLAIYENVKNIVGKKFKQTFDLFVNELHEYGYNTYWKVLNAKNYGVPQNRERVYLIIIKKELDNGNFKFPKEFDNGIRLKDVLEKEVDEKYYLSQDKTEKLILQLKDKDKYMQYANTITANYNNGITNDEIKKCRRQVVVEDNKCIQVEDLNHYGYEDMNRVYSPNGICPALRTMQGGNRQPKILEDFYANRDVREYEDYSPTLRADRQGLKVVHGCSTRTRNYIDQPEQLEIRNDELSNSITTVQKDSMALELTNKPMKKYNINNGGQGERVYDTNGISVALSSNHNGRDVLLEHTESPSPELVGGIGKINFGKQYRQGNRVYDADKTAMCLLSQPVGNTGGNSYLYLIQDDEQVEKVIEKTDKNNIFKIRIELTDGKISKTIYREIEEEFLAGVWSNWTYGNYSCDCNRSILLYGIEESFEECSEGKIKVKVSLGNIVLYNDLDLADITPQDDKSAIENISSEYQFAKDKCMDFYNKNGYLPEMFNPYNQAEITDIAPTQTTSCNRSCSSATVLIKDIYYRIRKLIPLECFRLMGFDDADFYILKENSISDSQCYKMAGNSIVVDVLYYIMLELNKAMPYLLEDIKLSSFFSGIGAFEKAIIKLQDLVNN